MSQGESPMNEVPPPNPDVFEIPLDDATRRILEGAEDALRAVRDALTRRGINGAGPALANGSLVVARPAGKATLAGLLPDRVPVATPPGPSGIWEGEIARPLLAALRAKVEEEAEI